MKFRKKPVVIEACLWGDENELGWPDSWIPIPSEWSLAEYEGRAVLEIPTLEGVMRAERGDWIIRGVAGEFYPCKPDIFEATYEPVASGGRE